MSKQMERMREILKEKHYEIKDKNLIPICNDGLSAFLYKIEELEELGDSVKHRLMEIQGNICSELVRKIENYLETK